MPAIKILPNGGTVSIDHTPGTHERAKRGSTQGWTPRASRGNRDFLWSVRAPELTHSGYAVTLTIKTCPESSQDWQRLRRAWVKRLERAGMVRLHWVTEWQRRGVPHLHAAVWLPDDVDHRYIIGHWLSVALPYGCSERAQDVRELTGTTGWFEYLAKHAARSVSNYQRSPDSMPQGWEKTGRVWGYSGDWPRDEQTDVTLNDAGFYRYRRLWMAYAIAKARAKGDFYRVRYLRNYLQTSDRSVSSQRAFSEWASRDVQLAMIAAVATRPDVEVS